VFCATENKNSPTNRRNPTSRPRRCGQERSSGAHRTIDTPCERTEQSTHPVRDAQWARLLDLLIGAAIRRTYRWVSRINFPDFRAKGIERCAPCVIPFQIWARRRARSSSYRTRWALVARGATTLTFHSEHIVGRPSDCSQKSGVKASFQLIYLERERLK